MTDTQPLKIPAHDHHWRMEIGDRLITLRLHKKLKLSEAGKYMGIAPGLLSKYEQGLNFPGHRNLARMAFFYDCSIDFILVGLGWGGVAVPSWDQLIHQASGIIVKPAPRAPGRMIPVKLEPKAPPPPLKIGVKKAKPAPKKAKSKAKKATPVKAAPKKRKGDRMSYDFSLD